MSSRISPLSPPYTPEQQSLLTELVVPASVRDDPIYKEYAKQEPSKFFRTWIRHPSMTKAFQAVREWMHSAGLVTPRERELIALRVCARSGATKEWSLRVAIYGEKVGLTPDQIRSTAAGNPSDGCWPKNDALIMQAVDELHATSTISDDLWAALSASKSPEVCMEVFFTVGWYVLLCFIANGVDMEGEEWATTPFPPESTLARAPANDKT